MVTGDRNGVKTFGDTATARKEAGSFVDEEMQTRARAQRRWNWGQTADVEREFENPEHDEHPETKNRGLKSPWATWLGFGVRQGRLIHLQRLI
jgi:hypothetical protein